MADVAPPDPPTPPAGTTEQIRFWLELWESGAVSPPMDSLYEVMLELAKAGYGFRVEVGLAPRPDDPTRPAS